MKFVFSRTDSLGSRVIRWVDGGAYSHVSIVDRDGRHVIEATYNDGVRRRRLDTLIAERPDSLIVEFDVKDEVAAFDWLYQQVGKPYDWTAVFLVPLRAGVEKEDCWYCAELALGTARAAGRHLDRLTSGVEHCLKLATLWQSEGAFIPW